MFIFRFFWVLGGFLLVYSIVYLDLYLGFVLFEYITTYLSLSFSSDRYLS